MPERRELRRRLLEMERVCERCKNVCQASRQEIERFPKYEPFGEKQSRDLANRTIEGLVDAFDQVLTNMSGKVEVDRAALGLFIGGLVYAFLGDERAN